MSEMPKHTDFGKNKNRKINAEELTLQECQENVHTHRWGIVLGKAYDLVATTPQKTPKIVKRLSAKYLFAQATGVTVNFLHSFSKFKFEIKIFTLKT